MLYFLSASGLTGLPLFAAVLAFLLAVCIGMTFHEYAHARAAFRAVMTQQVLWAEKH